MNTTTQRTMTLPDLQRKYAVLLETARALGITPVDTREIDGRLVIKGEAPYQMEKNLFWDKLKTFNSWNDEVKADITVKNKDLLGVHTVAAGDTLSKIAERYLGDARRYPEIFELNKDVLTDPNVIRVGQKLKLPVKG